MKNDDAVSPVIGVILMVAITVILAAVIAAFVFGMAGNIQKTKIIAATAQSSGTDIYVTYQGGQDDSALIAVNVTAPNGTTYQSTTTNCVLATGGTAAKPAVGAVCKLGSGSATGGQDHIVVVGRFSDGTSQVITDTYV